MDRLNRFQPIYLLALAVGLTAFAGCAPEVVRRPTLYEARIGKGPMEGDTALRPGEIRAEVVEVDPDRREIRVIRTDDSLRETLPYHIPHTKVIYYGSEYTVDYLESGDVIAFRRPPWSNNFVDIIHIQVPVQGRVGPGLARRPPPPRPHVIEGTVERIDYELGVFDLRPRVGRMVTVTIPYNARSSDVENFRRLRRGDYVRVEGEFVNPESFQLLAFAR